MSITTEEAERLAQTHDLVRFTLSMKTPEHDLTAAALRSLAAERDALRAENEKMRAALKECADDLEAEIKHRHGDWVPKYPRERLKRDQDMAPVIKARAALGEKE
jgi:hypothetical protein